MATSINPRRGPYWIRGRRRGTARGRLRRVCGSRCSPQTAGASKHGAEVAGFFGCNRQSGCRRRSALGRRRADPTAVIAMVTLAGLVVDTTSQEQLRSRSACSMHWRPRRRHCALHSGLAAWRAPPGIQVAAFLRWRLGMAGPPGWRGCRTTPRTAAAGTGHEQSRLTMLGFSSVLPRGSARSAAFSWHAALVGIDPSLPRDAPRAQVFSGQLCLTLWWRAL